MRSQEVVVLQARENGQNVPGEFVIAAVDPTGKIHQYGGINADIADEVIGICEQGVSLVIRDDPTDQRRRIVEAQAQGEVPEDMARNAVERYGPAPGTPGAGNEKPQGMGQRPV